jgi:hypothetical protein
VLHVGEAIVCVDEVDRKSDKRRTPRKSDANKTDSQEKMLTLTRTKLIVEKPSSYLKRSKRSKKTGQSVPLPSASDGETTVVPLTAIEDILGGHFAMSQTDQTEENSELKARQAFWTERVEALLPRRLSISPDDSPTGATFAIVTQSNETFAIVCPTRQHCFEWIMLIDRATGKLQKHIDQHTMYDGRDKNFDYSILAGLERQALVRWLAFDAFREQEDIDRLVRVSADFDHTLGGSLLGTSHFESDLESSEGLEFQVGGWEYDRETGRIKAHRSVKCGDNMRFLFNGDTFSFLVDGAPSCDVATWDGDSLIFNASKIPQGALGGSVSVKEGISFDCRFDTGASRFRVAQMMRRASDGPHVEDVISTTMWRWSGSHQTLSGPDNLIVWRIHKRRPRSSSTRSKSPTRASKPSRLAPLHPAVAMFWQLWSQSLRLSAEPELRESVADLLAEPEVAPSKAVVNLTPVSASVNVAVAVASVDVLESSAEALLLASPQLSHAGVLKSLLLDPKLEERNSSDGFDRLMAAHVLLALEISLYEEIAAGEFLLARWRCSSRTSILTRMLPRFPS